jgi:integrase
VDAETRALAEALRRKLDADSSTTTVGQLWSAYELSEKGRLASWRTHAQRWRDHVEPFFGAELAADVGPARIDAYRVFRLNYDAAVATVNREIALLRRLLRFSARRGTIGETRLHGPGMTAELIVRERNVRTTVIEDNPAARITLPALLLAAPAKLRAFILLLHHSGMRRTEASLLQRDRIDRQLGVAWVPDEDTKGGGAGRYVPISREVMRLLDALEPHPKTDYMFWAARGKGRPEHPDTWTHRFGRLVRKLGIEGPNGPPWLHDLRRSFITLSRRRGEDTTSIIKISGHKTMIAFQRYNVFSLVDVLASKARIEAARAAELAERRPAKRLVARAARVREGAA